VREAVSGFVRKQAARHSAKIDRMLKKDYLIRQIHELVRVLFELLLKTKENPQKEEREIFNQAYSFLNLTKDDLISRTSGQIIELFENETLGLEKLELLGFLLFNEFKFADDFKDEYLLHLSKDILTYVDQHSDSYSLERQMIFARMKGINK